MAFLLINFKCICIYFVVAVNHIRDTTFLRILTFTENYTLGQVRTFLLCKCGKHRQYKFTFTYNRLIIRQKSDISFYALERRYGYRIEIRRVLRANRLMSLHNMVKCSCFESSKSWVNASRLFFALHWYLVSVYFHQRIALFISTVLLEKFSLIFEDSCSSFSVLTRQYAAILPFPPHLPSTWCMYNYLRFIGFLESIFNNSELKYLLTLWWSDFNVLIITPIKWYAELNFYILTTFRILF